MEGQEAAYLRNDEYSSHWHPSGPHLRSGRLLDLPWEGTGRVLAQRRTMMDWLGLRPSLVCAPAARQRRQLDLFRVRSSLESTLVRPQRWSGSGTRGRWGVYMSVILCLCCERIL